MIVRDNHRLSAPSDSRLENFARMSRSLIHQPISHTQRSCAKRMILRIERQNKKGLLLLAHLKRLAKDDVGILRLFDFHPPNILRFLFVTPSHQFKCRRQFQHFKHPDTFDFLFGMKSIVLPNMSVKSPPIASDQLAYRSECIKESPCRLKDVASCRTGPQENRQQRFRIQFARRNGITQLLPRLYAV